MTPSPIAFAVAILAGITTPVLASLTTAQEETLAAILVAEAGGESRAAMQGVMETIDNRAGRLKQNWVREALKPGQYSVLNGTNPVALIYQARTHRRWEMALSIVRNFQNKGLVNGSKYFHSPMDLIPYWAKGQPVIARIGKLTFYRL